jgi:hypothetical protein
MKRKQSPIPPVKIRRNTGLRISERKAARIAHALAHGRSIRSICAEFKTSHGVVSALQKNRPDLMNRALTQAREHWSTLAALTSSELLYRMPEMDAATLAKTAAVSARAAELMRVDEPAAEVKSEPAAEAWAQFVTGLQAEQRQMQSDR